MMANIRDLWERGGGKLPQWLDITGTKGDHIDRTGAETDVLERFLSGKQPLTIQDKEPMLYVRPTRQHLNIHP